MNELLLMAKVVEMSETGMTQAELAERFCKSLVWIGYTLEIHKKCHPTVKMAMRQGLISRVNCISLAQLNHEDQLDVMERAKKRDDDNGIVS